MSAVDLIVRGGIFMYPIIFCSILGLAIFIERLWMLRKKRVIPVDFVRYVEDLLKKRKLSEAIFVCKGNPSSIAKIFHEGLKNSGRGMWFVKEAIEERGEQEAVVLEKRVGVLATIANLTPLLGLLGTVSGMIKTFNVLAINDMATPAQLAGGIAEALITTATGLCVAIPMLVFHRILKDRAQSLIYQMEESSLRIIDVMENSLARLERQRR